MDGRIRISQCMIVKNEERNIRQALSWGRDIMWEQVVVDTGSADCTVEIASRMGARVCHYKWQDDFAAAKNYAIEQAKGDWIAFLDADEYIRPQEAEGIPGYMEGAVKEQHMALLAPWINLRDDGGVFFHGAQMRLFRNQPEVRYKGRIHENLAFNGRSLEGNQILDAGSAFSIYHTGYSESAAGDGSKARRNRILIEAELKERPDDGSLMGYLADSYNTEGDIEKAIFWYERAVSALTGKGVYDLQAVMVFTFLMVLLGTMNRKKRLREVYRLGAKYWPHEPDFDYVIGKYYTLTGEYERGKQHLKRAFSLLEKRNCSTVGAYMLGNMEEALKLMDLCHEHTGSHADAK